MLPKLFLAMPKLFIAFGQLKCQIQINYGIPNYLRHPKLFMASQIIYGILIFSYEKYMAKYEEENMERISWILKPNEKEIILIMHDECIFYSNNGKQEVWANRKVIIT